MNSVYRVLVPVGLWLGIVAFVLGNIMMLVDKPFLFRLTPGGILEGAEVFLLVAVGAYCAHRSGQRS